MGSWVGFYALHSILASTKVKRILQEKWGMTDKNYRLGYSLVEIKSKLKQAGFAKVKARYVYGFPGVLSWKLTTGWPSYVIKKSSLFFAFLPFYVVLAIVPVIVLNLLDIGFPHTKGKCIVVKAFK